MGKSKELWYDDLVEKLPINIYELHINCAEQAQLMHEVSEEVAVLKVKLKNLKIKYEYARAEMCLLIRNSPAEFGLSKITEATIGEVCDSSNELHNLKLGMNVLEHEFEKWDSLKNALDHRRSMLKAEVELYMGNYFSDLGVKTDEKLTEVLTDEVIQQKYKEKVEEHG